MWGSASGSCSHSSRAGAGRDGRGGDDHRGASPRHRLSGEGTPLTRVVCVTFDCADHERVATFWAEALGWKREGGVVRSADGGIYLEFMEVPEPKTVKNRLHLGLNAADLDAEIARLEALGATQLWEEIFPKGWTYRNVVMCDPEGNEFCIGNEGSGPPS